MGEKECAFTTGQFYCDGKPISESYEICHFDKSKCMNKKIEPNLIDDLDFSWEIDVSSCSSFAKFFREIEKVEKRKDEECNRDWIVFDYICNFENYNARLCNLALTGKYRTRKKNANRILKEIKTWK